MSKTVKSYALARHLLQGQSTYSRTVAPMLPLLLPVAREFSLCEPGLAAIVVLFAACVQNVHLLAFALLFILIARFTSREH